MSTLNANVTAGKVFSKDANDEALATIDDLNSLGVPTVTVDLEDQVATVDVQALAITEAKLSAAVADRMLTAVATVGDEATNVVTVTVQVKDSQGNNVGFMCCVEYWLSDAANYNLTADSFTGGGVAATAGAIVHELTTDTHTLCVTDGNGLLVLTFTETGANTLDFHLRIQDRHIAGSQTMTWTA